MSVIEPAPIRGPADSLKTFENEQRLRAEVERTFSRAEYVPESWWTNAADQIALQALGVPVQNVIGLDARDYSAHGRVAEADTATSLAYTDLGHVGPTFESVPAGIYEILFGYLFESGAGGDGFMAFSVNGDPPSDDEAARAWMSGAGRNPAVFATVVTLNGSSNNLTAKYRVASGTNTFMNRWATIKRVGNA